MSWWYPRFNRRFDIASGNGQVWLNGASPSTAVPGHSPQWFGDPADNLVLVGDDLRLVDLTTGQVVQAFHRAFNPRVGNTSGICAGAGHWCGWNPSDGLIYDDVSVDPAAAPGCVDQQTGALYYLTPYQSNARSVVINGAIVRANVLATEIVAGEDCATWGEYEPVRTLYGWSREGGVQKLSPLPSTELTFVGIPVRTSDGLWLVTTTHAGLIVHKWGGHEGYILEGAYYYHHARATTVSLLRRTWNRLTGRLNDSIAIVATGAHGQPVRVDQKLSDPRTDLRTYRPTTGNVAPDPIVAMNKKCWLVWFEFNQPPSILPPGNGILAIRYPTESGTIRDFAGVQFAQFVQAPPGGTVDDVEAAAAAATFPAVAYWDDNHWPRWPTLPESAWLCIRAYCPKGVTPAAFEADRRQVLDSAPPVYTKIALVCQAYTQVPVNSLTDDPGSLVPVFARLARDYPRITMLAPFSDQGRAGGMQDHPELRPLWQQLANGITGTPSHGGGIMLDWQKIHDYGDRRWAEMEVNRISWELDPQELGLCRPFQQKCFAEIASELYHNEGVPLDLFWKGGKPNYDDPADVADKLQHIGEDIVVDTPNMVYKDVVGAMGHPAADWNALSELKHVTPGDEARCSRPPKPLAQQPPVDPPIPPSTFAVDILAYDTVVRRSDPNGLLVRFDAHASSAIIEAWIYLEDGERKLKQKYPVGDADAVDGRYHRGISFKPVVNGTWRLIVKAWDVHGNVGQSDGTHMVTVTN